MAVLGDSISTGAVAHPDLSYNQDSLWNIFRGKRSVKPDLDYYNSVTGQTVSQLVPPTRLWPGVREYDSSAHWLGLHLLQSVSRTYLDTEQYSWAYQLASQQGVPPENLLIAAQDGARMRDAIVQIDRVLDHTGGIIPEHVYLFFTGNDLCGPTLDFVTDSERYKSALRSALLYLQKNGRVDGNATLTVVEFLGVLQITNSPEIMAKKIPAQDQETTCGEIANAKKKAGEPATTTDDSLKMLLGLLPSSPAAMCPTLYGKNLDFREKDQSVMLANRVRSYRKVSREVVVELGQSMEKSGIKLRYAEKSGQLVFRAEDIANDCFHLSLKGQKRLAEAVGSDGVGAE